MRFVLAGRSTGDSVRTVLHGSAKGFFFYCRMQDFYYSHIHLQHRTCCTCTPFLKIRTKSILRTPHKFSLALHSNPNRQITNKSPTIMCVTNTARRRSITMLVLPTNLLPPSSAASPFKFETTAAPMKTPSAEIALPPSSAASPFKFETTAAPMKTPSADVALTSIMTPDSQPSSSFSDEVKTHHDASDQRSQGSSTMESHYSDHAADQTLDTNLIKYKAKGGVIFPFPVKLHEMLNQIESDGLADVVSWASHGRCLCVHKPKEFVRHVMPHYFKQTKMASFQRQLNLYGFSRLTGGPDKGGYYHELFLRGKVSLAYKIHRMRIKGTGVRLPTNPDNEPNLYALPPLTKDALPEITSMEVTSSALAPLHVLSKPKSILDACAVPSCDSYDYSRKIAQAKQKQEQEHHAMIDDVLFFEGHPFHYIDSNEFLKLNAKESQQAHLIKEPSPSAPPNLVHSHSGIVSESDSDCDESILSRSPQTVDKVTSSALALPLEEDIDFFFQSIGMPTDIYHEQLELMSDHDDDAFGDLLEMAIS
jgi:hypothetical protein